MGKKEACERESLKPDQKLLLLRSIAQYLDRCGFSKCLKKFLSDAEIEKKDLDSSLPDLEEIYCQYLKKSNPEAGDSITQQTEDIQTCGGKEEEIPSDDCEKGKKDKKKKKKESKAEVNHEKSKDGSSEDKKETDVKISEEPKNCDSSAAEASKVTHEDAEKGEKDKRKKKKEVKSEVTKEKVKDGSSKNEKKTDVEMGEGQKDKKKKSKSKESESLDDSNTHEENEAEKVSKKRKRPENEEENDEQTTDDKEDEESKRRKKEGDVDIDSVEKTPAKQPDVQENEDIENTAGKSANQKSGKKHLSGSKEPKKPFQRVNVEEVEFTDERLKDNSYWAKDGADSGYGAKAQEVLGQVKGKGFRHEKTKKKRGSYRGGQIDLHSHSVKFNYSDEE